MQDSEYILSTARVSRSLLTRFHVAPHSEDFDPSTLSEPSMGEVLAGYFPSYKTFSSPGQDLLTSLRQLRAPGTDDSSRVVIARRLPEGGFMVEYMSPLGTIKLTGQSKPVVLFSPLDDDGDGILSPPFFHAAQQPFLEALKGGAQYALQPFRGWPVAERLASALFHFDPSCPTCCEAAQRAIDPSDGFVGRAQSLLASLSVHPHGGLAPSPLPLPPCPPAAIAAAGAPAAAPAAAAAAAHPCLFGFKKMCRN